MIPLGIGEIIGSLAIGKVSDKYGSKPTVVIVLILTLTAFAVLFGTIASY
jgi:predicted MFS family arabinose efflux permease